MNIKRLLKSLWLTLTSILLVILSPLNVLAQDITFYGTNDIIYYDPGTCSTGESSAGNGTVGPFKNPVINSNAPDPSVIVGEDGKFYMYTTGFQQFVSDDMVKWKKLNDGISWIKNNPGWSDNRWAPDIAKVGDKYILTISGRSSGNRTIGYATSNSAAGPFTYQGQLLKSSDRGKYGMGFDIDPNIVQTDKGIYLYYGSGRGYINYAKLTQNGDKLTASTSKKLFTTKHGKGPVLAEGAYVHKHGEYYYLYFSTGNWDKSSGGTPYELHVARSKSPTGPFTEKASAILKGNGSFTHPGHNSVLTDASGNDFIVYHAYPKGKDYRAALIDKITYKDDWPVINDGNGPSSGQQTGSTGGPAISSATSATGGQINATVAHANVQTQNGPGANYTKNQQQRVTAAVDKFKSDSPDFITLNEIAPSVNTNVGEYKSFKQDYPNAKTTEDTALRILSNSTKWKKVDGGIELIHPYETDPKKRTPSEPMYWKDRYALWATYQSASNGATMSVIVTHWNVKATFYSGRAKTQGENIKALTQKLIPKGPVLVSGDFNYWNTKDKIKQSSSPTVVFDGVLKSVFKPGEGTVVDWMFYSDQLKNIGKRVVAKDSSISDHPFIVGEFEGFGGPAANNVAACVCSQENLGDSMLIGNDNQEKVWNFLKGKGMTNTQAAGSMGNLEHEGNFNPKIVEGGKWGGRDWPAEMDTIPPPVGPQGQPGYGIVQWTSPGRKEGLQNIADGNNAKVYDLSLQLKFMWSELEGPYKDRALTPLLATNSLEEATRIWQDHYEVGSNFEPRFTSAKKFLAKYETGSDSTSSSTSSESVDSSGSSCPDKNGGSSEFSADGMTIYNQEDPRWASKPFGTTGKTIKSSGCGPTSMATIITALTGEKVTPDKTTDYANTKGMYVSGVGASWSLGPVLAEHWGLKSKKLGANVSEINKELQKGALIITSGTGAAPFTSSGHFITIRGVTDSGKWKIADSNGETGQKNSKKEWDPNVILGTANAGNIVAVYK